MQNATLRSKSRLRVRAYVYASSALLYVFSLQHSVCSLKERMLAKNRTEMSNWRESCMRKRISVQTVGPKLCDSPAEAKIAMLAAGTDQDANNSQETKGKWLRRIIKLLKTANESARRSARRS